MSCPQAARFRPAREPFEPQAEVTCVIPGHDRQGRETVAEPLEIGAGELEYAFAAPRGYEASFAYSPADA
jgi:hypothetical protein